MTGFSTFGLSEAMLNKLTTIGFETATPIQAKSIPVAMEGKDILGTAQTGTGKTGAFGLPLVNHILTKPHSLALVMTPTRELAVQVMTQIKAFLPEGSGVKTALLIGGEAMFKQLNQLQQKPRIIIGTPGRINDHLERDTLRLSKADFLVLDEADRMLDMGFGVQLEAISQYLPEVRQTLMFSATVPPNIMKLAKNYLNEPVRIETEASNVAAPKIKQELVHVNDDSKHDELVKLLDARSGQIIVFVKTKHGADRLARRLVRENHSADAIHGDLRQGQRDRVIRTFRKNEVRILVATDVAARGLDIPMLETVINYDLPQCPEDYVHRIGRTGRNGQEGEAICLISGQDRSKWAAIDRLLNPGKAKAEGGYERPGAKRGSGGRSFGGGAKRSFGGSRDGGSRDGGRNYGPKSSFGERKFGGGDKFAAGGDKPSWKSSFKEKAPSFDREDRPQYSESANRKPWSPEGPSQDRSFSDRSERGSDRPARSFGDRNDRPQRSFGGDRSDAPKRAWIPEAEFRKQRGEGSDRPQRSFGDRNERGSDRPARSFGDRNDRPQRSFGDRPARSEGDRSDAPKRAWVPEAEFRKQRGEGSGKPSFGGKKEWSKDAPKKSWGDRDGNKKSFGDKPAFKKEGGFGGAKKSFGSKPFGAKSDGGNGAPRRSRPAA